MDIKLSDLENTEPEIMHYIAKRRSKEYPIQTQQEFVVHLICESWQRTSVLSWGTQTEKSVIQSNVKSKLRSLRENAAHYWIISAAYYLKPLSKVEKENSISCNLTFYLAYSLEQTD